jgi:transposase
VRASARLSVREIPQADLEVYARVLPQKSLLLDSLEWIDWDQFTPKLQHYYRNSGEGQPPYPPEILLKLEFLGCLYGASRRQLIERARCDLHWKYFLGLPIAASMPDHSTLSLFRSRLGPEGFREIFDELLGQARRHGLVSDRLRLKDATHVYADIAVPTALGLFAQLRTRMLAAVKAFDPQSAASFDVDLEQMRQRSQQGDDQTRLQARIEIVQDILSWIAEQTEPQDKTRQSGWQKLQQVRQLAEKILGDSANPQAGDKTISVVDPDARRGKHGEFYDGYLLDVMMDADSGLVTSLDVLPANGDEARNAIALIESEERAHGNDVEQLSIDGIGFNGEVLQKLTDTAGVNVEVFTPPRDFTTSAGFESSQFEPVEDGERVRCPAGELSGKASRKPAKPNTLSYTFSARKCSSCPLQAACCPDRKPTSGSGRRVTKNTYEREYAHARAVAQTEQYAEVRRHHPAIERKLNEFVRHHKARRAMYRGRWRVQVQQLMTAVAINVKRMIKLVQPCAPQPRFGLI